MNNKKKSFLPKNHLSTGNLFLDKILGGYSIGTSTLIYEDTYTNIYSELLKYYIAEGMVKDQKVFIFHSNDEFYVKEILKEVPYKSSQVESLLNSKKITEEVKIAWRYENIKYSNLIEDIVKSSDYVFDISRPIQNEYKKEVFISNLFDNSEEVNVNESSLLVKLRSLNLQIVKYISDHVYTPPNENGNEEQGKNVKLFRIIVPRLIDNDVSTDKFTNLELSLIKKELIILKNVIRSLNASLITTVNSSSLASNSTMKNIFNYLFDYVLSIKSFLIDNEGVGDYNAILKILKIPRINSLKLPFISVESDVYGILVDKRKIVIEQIDIGVEIDRNTKVKESKENKESKEKKKIVISQSEAVDF